ncbi:ABC transporter substrate-binding protein [Phytohabitans sp. ZYX-F-186]|uniref:ABC transporter substrate-binding protein n=1 Tax=Phytohabitans maris TaxID=3071409 RepID=A0ABU0ZER6_9ACTN|nr:ABC transporter substrate-binding protein [Phytohabitans sp. ZYX-F-186]MDQ7905553.1 ABC transporter substrate-binding protein [Phytohabitans sp. ZYX-F-186]
MTVHPASPRPGAGKPRSEERSDEGGARQLPGATSERKQHSTGIRWRLTTIGLVALTLLAAGCSGSTAATTGEKVLRLGMPAPAVSLDPAKAVTDALWVTELAYDPLIFRASDGSLQPRLAESWSYIGDNNTLFELKLRAGVKFSDGTPLNADVVKRNFEHYADASSAASKIKMFSQLEVVDDLTLRIHLSEPHPAMPELFTQAKFVGDLASGEALAKPDLMTTQTYGAGPYVLDPKATVPKDTYTFVRNTHYWKPEAAYYDKVVVKVIANANTALAALKTGQIDAIQGDFTTADAAKQAGLQVASTPRQWFGVIVGDADGKLVPELKDVRVRQALNYAVNREKIAKGLLGDNGVPTEQIVMPGQSGYNTTSFYTYDPAKAKDLLREAGHPNGFTLPVTTNTKRGLSLVVQAMVDDWKAIGITVDLKTEANDGTYSEAQTAAKLPVFGVSFGSDGEIHNLGTTLFQNSKTFNPFGISDPTVDKLRADAAAIPTVEGREALYKQLIRRLVETGRYVPVVAVPIYYYANDSIKGLAVSPSAQQADPVDFMPAK